MEQWFADNALVIAGFIATGGAALWRLTALEKRQDKRDEQAREDRRVLYQKLEQQGKEFAELRGELRGRGVINGSE